MTQVAALIGWMSIVVNPYLVKPLQADSIQSGWPVFNRPGRISPKQQTNSPCAAGRGT
jgi:hypothetical protein